MVARGSVAAPEAVVERFLSDLSNHVWLAPGSVQMLSLSRRQDGEAEALVRLRGPLGVSRTALTELFPSVDPESIRGTAQIGTRTKASIAWTVRGRGEASDVTLCATVDAAGPVDALLLRLGGRRWLSRKFAAALERLAGEVAPVALDAPEVAPSGRRTATAVAAAAGRPA